MKPEIMMVLVGWSLAMFFYGTYQLFPEFYHLAAYVGCLLMPFCGDTVIWSRHGNRIWQRDLNNSVGNTIIVNADALAISIESLPAASKIEAPANPILVSRADQCPSRHVTCQPLHNNCCPINKDCCGLGCCRDGAHCVDDERGWCCPRAAVLCGDRCVRGDCCAGGTHACPNEGETCCGRSNGRNDEGKDDDKWFREMRCCKKGEYCHAGNECRKAKEEEGRGVKMPGSVWAWAVCALAATFSGRHVFWEGTG